MEKLPRKEVEHVADLARIHVDEEEIEKYQIELKQLLDEVDKIKDIKGYDEEILIAPTDHDARMREDIEKDTVKFEELKTNIPNTFGNFVEVPVMINE